MLSLLFRLTAAVAALGLLVPRGLAAPVTLPDLGDESAAIITPAQERKLGEEFMRQARRSLAFVDDPELSGYLQGLGQRLVAHSESPYPDFRFFLVNDPSINAFAVPGGFIGVHTGLILAAQSEAELASVLAHETAHVTQRHIPRMIAESQRVTVPAMAALLASILLAGSGHQGAEAGIALTTATVAQKGLNYSRALEEEADRLGMGILVRAGFDPRAMPAFFERMQQANRANESSLPEFLRTHPVTTNRIAEARNRAEQYTSREVRDSSDFHHTRARLRAGAPGQPAEIVRGFKTNLAQGLYYDADAERYGYAVALLRNKDLGAARAEIQKLIEHHPNRAGYRLSLAEIELAGGRYSEALTIYAEAHRRFPVSAAVKRHYGEALLKSGKASTAKEVLGEATRRQPDDPVLYKLLGQAAGRAGAPVEAHRALAEHYYLMGSLNAAIEQLQLAARFAGENFYLQSSIEARISSIREEIALFQGK